MSKQSYFLRLSISFDQLVNTIFNGYPDNTLSARAWLWHINGEGNWTKNAINILFFWQKNHCFSSYESELKRKHLPPEMRS